VDGFQKNLVRTCPWLAPFLIVVDVEIRKRLLAVKLVGTPPYEPQLVDLLLNDISRLLDRALLYRRDANDLEILATKHAVDYKLFLDTYQIDTELSELSLSTAQSEIQQTNNSLACTQFSNSTDKDPLASGLATQAEGISGAAAITANNEKRRRELIGTKACILKQSQDDMELRHTTPGNAHNFSERF
jgi:hypothetical protein